MIQWMRLLPVVAPFTGPALAGENGERRIAEVIERRLSSGEFMDAVRGVLRVNPRSHVRSFLEGSAL